MVALVFSIAGLSFSLAVLTAALWRNRPGNASQLESDYYRHSRNAAAIGAAFLGFVAARVVYEPIDSAGLMVASVIFMSVGYGALLLSTRLLKAALALSALDETLDTEQDFLASVGRRPGTLQLIASPLEIVVRQQNTLSAFECSLGRVRMFFQGEADDVSARLTGRHDLICEIEFPDGRMFIGPTSELIELFPDVR